MTESRKCENIIQVSCLLKENYSIKKTIHAGQLCENVKELMELTLKVNLIKAKISSQCTVNSLGNPLYESLEISTFQNNLKQTKITTVLTKKDPQDIVTVDQSMLQRLP